MVIVAWVVSVLLMTTWAKGPAWVYPEIRTGKVECERVCFDLLKAKTSDGDHDWKDVFFHNETR